VYALLNSEFVHDMSLAFADRLAHEARDPDAQIRTAFVEMFDRAPTAQETQLVRTQFDKLLAYHRRTPPPAKPVRKPLVRSITSELTGKEVKVEEDADPGRYEENLQPSDVGPDTRALADVVLALFNTNEFVYVY
jgi:hypothetical protein